MSFINERRVKATRKAGRCEACRTDMPAGSAGARWAGLVNGDFESVLYHPECRAAEIELNDLLDYRSGDEWWPLQEIDHESHAWLIAEHPIVAERMKIARPASAS